MATENQVGNQLDGCDERATNRLERLSRPSKLRSSKDARFSFSNSTRVQALVL
jgi:hypothetical protein